MRTFTLIGTLAVAGSIALCGGGEVRAADQVILARHAKCLWNNRATYKAVKDQPIIIVLPLCPKVSPTPEEIAKLNSNLRIKRRPDDSPVSVTQVLVLDRQELDCVVSQLRGRLKRSKANDTLTIDPSKCSER